MTPWRSRNGEDSPGERRAGRLSLVDRPRHSLWSHLWSRLDAARVRELVETVNDGIMTVSGFSAGLASDETLYNLWSPIVLLAALAGALSVAGIALASGLADREAELLAAEEEQRLLELSPDQLNAELAAHWKERGLQEATAQQVADELMAIDPIGAHLELDGFDERTTVGDAFIDAYTEAIAFLFGAFIPLLISVLTPGEWRAEYTVAAAAASLVVSSIALARLGHTRIWQTLLRSLVIGLAALGGSYLVGEALL